MNDLNLLDDKSLEKLQDKISEVEVAMLSTCNEQGVAHAQPMHTLDFDKYGSLWFYAFNDSDRVNDITQKNTVNVVYSCPEKGIFVSISGFAQLVADRDKINTYWHERFRAWIPEGKDAPGLYLLKVSIRDAELWDVDTNSVVRFFKETTARLKGERADVGSHVRFHY